MTDDEPSAPMGYRLGGIWSTTAFVGRGPVGEVYECRRSETEGTFIAKLLPEELLESSETWSSYLSAVSAAASLPTEATVRHVAFGSDLQLGCPFVVTERVPWPSLASSIKKNGPVSAKAWGKTLAALVALLERAHAAEIPHGRLTPTNVFVSPDDPAEVRVTDFGLGIARAAGAGETLGGSVLGWAGPECEEVNAKPSPSGDVYSLGLLTFFALTGKRPFRALDAEQVHRKLLRSEMTASLKSAAEIAKKLGVELDPAFDKWFSRAIVPSPDARYSSVKLQGEAFEHVLRRVDPGKATPEATKPTNASLVASPPRPARTSAPLARGGAIGGADELDDQPTIRLKLDTLFAGKQRAQPTAPASEVAARKPAPVAPRAVSGRALTALAPPLGSPAPPPVAPAEPAGTLAPPVAVPAHSDAIASPPVTVPTPAAIASPPVTVPAPPAAVIAPPAAVIAPPPAVIAPPAAVIAPPPADDALASATPSSSSPGPLEAGTAGANARLVSTPKTAVAVGAGLLLFGLVVGIVIGERRGKSEAPAVREPARSAAPLASLADKAPPEASAPASASAQPSAGPALASASPAGPASASVTAPATATAPATKAHEDIVVMPVMPVPTATTSARKPHATKPDATKPPAAPARKKPCGTFINPCQ